MVTQIEPDILEYEVKWALGSIPMNKASEGDGIPAELLTILKDDAVKMLHSICQQIWKTQQWPQVWKSPFLFQFQRREMPNNVQSTTQLHSFHMLARLCSKAFKPGFSSASAVNWELPDAQEVSKRNQRSNCQHSLDHRESNRVPEKHLLLLHRLY